jgi:glycosyltransferase A (GT-A) superfamily protein (DUF2064 family)
MTTLLVMAKSPVPGRVKTRLTPPYTPAEAAGLAEAALVDTLDLVCAAPATRRVLALEGAPGPWLPPGIEVLPQQGHGLDERIAHALAALTGPTVLIGMDTPQLTMPHLAVDFSEVDAWFGPAADGGFWGLALRDPDPSLVLGVPMSRRDTGALQLSRLRAANLRVGLLPTLRDVDTADDAAAVAAECASHGAGANFARRHAALTRRLAGTRVG